MILVGNQRGGAKNLALHLLKQENEHVQVHELRGFASDNLVSALNESYAISKATRCKQFLFSLSLNPPPHEQVRTVDFEAAIERAENELGLSGQPRAIVFHEKEGRRHAHAVWSRIKVDEMKAVQLSFSKRKLTDLSRDLFIEHQWKNMPRGLMKSEERNPCNFSLEEWQQAKRAGRDAREIKTAIQDCWAVSDSRPAFMQALQERGYKLAKGDRRGFVAVDMNGEPYAVSRWAGIKTKDVRARLGDFEDGFPSVEMRKAEFDREIAERLTQLRNDEERKEQAERERDEVQRKALVQRQREERARQSNAIKARWECEAEERQQRFNRGLRGLLDRVTGRTEQIRQQNIREAMNAMHRDRSQCDELIFSHLNERRALDERRRQSVCTMQERTRELELDIARYEPARRAQDQPQKRPPPQFDPDQANPPAGSRAEFEDRQDAILREWRERSKPDPRNQPKSLDLER